MADENRTHVQVPGPYLVTVNPPVLPAVTAMMAMLVRDHRKGKHPYGLMRRDCPLCNP